MILNNAKQIYLGDTPVSKIYKGSSLIWGDSDLPAGYTKVAYLEQVSGYFDSGVIPSLDLVMECRIYAVTSGYFCGRRKSSTTATRYYPLSISATYGFLNCKRTESTGSSIIGIVGDTLYNKYFDIVSTIGADEVKMSVNGVEFSVADTGTNIPTSSLPLFGQANTDSVSISTRAPAGTRCCYARFIRNGEIIRDLVPCLDNNKVACFYDKVTGETLYSKMGTYNYGLVE